MMLLPQSSAFNYLKIRLESVSTLGMLRCIPERYISCKIVWYDIHTCCLIFFWAFWSYSTFAISSSPELKIKETEKLSFSELLDTFRDIQLKHAMLRKAGIKDHTNETITQHVIHHPEYMQYMFTINSYYFLLGTFLECIIFRLCYIFASFHVPILPVLRQNSLLAQHADEAKLEQEHSSAKQESK